MVLDVASAVGPDGWITWEALTAQVDRKTVARWTAKGTLVRLQPGVYATSAAAEQWAIRVEAAVLSRGGVASHRTALALWGLVPPGGPIHVTVEPTRSNRRSAGVVLHRAHELHDAIRRVDGVPVTCVERTLVDTWAGRGTSLSPPCELPRSRRCAVGCAARTTWPPSWTGARSFGKGVAGRAHPATRRGMPERTGDLGLPERAAGPRNASLHAPAPGRGGRPDVLP